MRCFISDSPPTILNAKYHSSKVTLTPAEIKGKYFFQFWCLHHQDFEIFNV